MKKKNIRYRWRFWTLWKSFDYEEINGGGTDAVFTINLKFIWQQIKIRFL